MRACWQDRASFPDCRKSNGKLRSSRDCCLRVDDTFESMHNDLQNLRPAVGELNQVRSDHPYGIVSGEDRRFGAFDFEDQEGVAEPAIEDRGDVTRTYFYMEQAGG